MAAAILGILLIASALLDAFETIVLPRTVKRRWRLSTGFFTLSELGLHAANRVRLKDLRQALIVAFAPMTMISLIAVWALLLIFGYALLDWGPQVRMNLGVQDFGASLYYSGVTFFTLGFGDLAPTDAAGRVLAVLEAGTGFGFLALVISYVPVLYTSFSRREVRILLLDSKAGSEPTAGELMRRHGEAGRMSDLTGLLKEWESFAGELMESMLSFPILAYYRSQHDDQSWLKSLTAIMDACALIEAGFQGEPEWEGALRFQAQATFAMGRHLIVDLAYVLDAEPSEPHPSRLGEEDFVRLKESLAALGLLLDDSAEAKQRLTATREEYEPYVCGLAKALVLDLPRWLPHPTQLDNWQTSAWDGQHF